MALLTRLCEYGKQKENIENLFFDILKTKTKELEVEGKVQLYRRLGVVSPSKHIH